MRLTPPNRSILVAEVVPNERVPNELVRDKMGAIGAVCPMKFSPEVSKDPVTVAVTLGPESSKVNSKTSVSYTHLTLPTIYSV